VSAVPTTHTWNPNNTGYIYDTNDYTDGTPFADGDTLVVNGGNPNAQSISGNLAMLRVGSYQFNASGASEGVQFKNMGLPGGGLIAESGQNSFAWSNLGKFVNGGTVRVGSPTASGSLDYLMGDGDLSGDASFTNNGTMLLQNGSVFKIQTDPTTNGTFLNAAGAVLGVNSGSDFFQSNYFGIPNSTFVNNGLVAVNGAAGRTTEFDLAANYKGTGLLSVRGAPGAAANTTYADLQGPWSGTLDIASGGVKIEANPSGSSSVNLLDGNSDIWVNAGINFATVAPFATTINGFQAGNSLNVSGPLPDVGSFNYDPSTHVLSVYYSGTGARIAQLIFAGNYTTSDFQVTNNSYDGFQITTTSTANALPAFSTKDTATGAVGGAAGAQYAGGVDYLQSQYIWDKSDGANVTAHVPDAFLKGNAGNDALRANSGSNVLDGNLGSNFLVGATGADGGSDTFLLDSRQSAPTWDTLVNFHPGDSVTLYGYTPGQSAMAWADGDGTPGYTGATIHAAFDGTNVNGSVTFAGISLADAQSKFTITSGNNGINYLYVHYNL